MQEGSKDFKMPRRGSQAYSHRIKKAAHNVQERRMADLIVKLRELERWGAARRAKDCPREKRRPQSSVVGKWGEQTKKQLVHASRCH